jgi:SET domain-containing protein 6
MAENQEENDFEKKSRSFVDWLKQNGTTISDKIQLADLRHRSAGRGVVATADLDEDEELFSIPRSSILMTDNSTINDHLGTKVKDQDPWLSLILTMLYEYRGVTQSNWKPYFDVLPTEFDTLMYWTEEELEHLQGSAVVNKIGKLTADSTFHKLLLPIVRDQPIFKADNLSDADIIDLSHRMGSTIMAYAFDIETPSQLPRSEEGGWEEDSDAGETLPKGMVPLADMLNADADHNNAKLFHEEDKVVMKTINAVKAGEELFNDYGPLPRSDVLRRYGYVTEHYAKYDVVELSLELVKEVALENGLPQSDLDSRIVYLEEQGVLEDGYDIYRSTNEDGQFPEDLSILLNTLALPSADFEKLKKKDKLPKPELSRSATELLHKVLVRRRSAYPGNTDSASQPAIEATSDFSNARSDYRRRMASQVTAGEIALLDEAIESTRPLDAVGSGKRSRSTVAETAAPKTAALDSKKQKTK